MGKLQSEIVTPRQTWPTRGLKGDSYTKTKSSLTWVCLSYSHATQNGSRPSASDIQKKNVNCRALATRFTSQIDFSKLFLSWLEAPPDSNWLTDSAPATLMPRRVYVLIAPPSLSPIFFPPPNETEDDDSESRVQYFIKVLGATRGWFRKLSRVCGIRNWKLVQLLPTRSGTFHLSWQRTLRRVLQQIPFSRSRNHVQPLIGSSFPEVCTFFQPYCPRGLSDPYCQKGFFFLSLTRLESCFIPGAKQTFT